MKPAISNLEFMVALSAQIGLARDCVGKIGVMQFAVWQTFARNHFCGRNEVGWN